MSRKRDIGKYCWKCLYEGKERLATCEKNGFPLCDEHRDTDPDTMGTILFQLLCQAI